MRLDLSPWMTRWKCASAGWCTSLEAIGALKERYWNACDQEGVPAVRDCFADRAIEVDFDGTAQHLHRDDSQAALRAVFAARTRRRDPDLALRHGGSRPSRPRACLLPY